MWELECTDEKRKEKKGGKEKEKEDGAKGQKAKNNREKEKKTLLQGFYVNDI